MKKKIALIFVALIMCGCLFFTACTNYTKSLKFYEITEDGPYLYPAGEIVVIENSDKEIKKLTVPSSYKGKPVTTIGACVFAGCYLLTEVNLPESIKYIEDDAFAYCESLTEIKLPESLLFIGWGAFESDIELASITIGKNVFRIAEKAFKDCNKLKDVYYSGTQEDWNKIEIWEGNECLLNATIHFSE